MKKHVFSFLVALYSHFLRSPLATGVLRPPTDDIHNVGINTCMMQQVKIIKLWRHEAKYSGCCFRKGIFIMITRSEKVGISIAS